MRGIWSIKFRQSGECVFKQTLQFYRESRQYKPAETTSSNFRQKKPKKLLGNA